jgi:hypothetical protein
MRPRLLAAVLGLSAAFDLLVAALLFFAPGLQAANFGVQLTSDVLFLGQVLGGFTLYFTAVCAYAAVLAWRSRPAAHALARIAGVFLLLTGAGFYWRLGNPQFLLLDSFRGAIFIALTFC